MCFSPIVLLFSQTVLPMAGVSLTCPAIADTTNEMECEVAATGQAPTGTLDFDDGNTANFNLQGMCGTCTCS